MTPYPGQHLHGNEGFGDIVIGTHIQAQDLILGFGLGGQKQNGSIGNLPDFCGGGNAVHLGHHDIQQNQMDVVFLNGFQRFFSGKGFVEPVALGGKIYF
jgi:hypothetical protein